MPLRISSFRVRCYHDCPNAAAIHAELKRRHIDAAVVDHAFVMSSLQLAVALFRAEGGADVVGARTPSPLSPLLHGASPGTSPVATTTTTVQTPPSSTSESSTAAATMPPPSRRISNSRQIFAALSLSHNLDRILQVLPPGPQTTSVAIIYRAPGWTGTHSSGAAAFSGPSWPSGAGDGELGMDEAVHACVLHTNSGAVEHSLGPTTAPCWSSAGLPFADAQNLLQYYSISEATLMAAQRTLTRADKLRVCAGAATEAEKAHRLRWHVLEVCVTTALAACAA